MIPKVVHYCWFGEKEMPSLSKRCISTWKKHLKDYEFILWTEKNAPLDVPFVRRALKYKMFAYVSDYVRFFALYKYGGIYLDVDMEIVKPLDNLLENRVFLGAESKRHIGLGIIGAEKNNEFIGDFLEFLSNLKIFKPLPWVLEDFIKTKYETLDAFKQRTGVKIYPPEYFYPYNPYLRDYPNLLFDDIKDSTYAIHHWQKSWSIPKSVFLKNRILKVYKKLKNRFLK
ncbi:glycosyltransferase [Desulfurobacterium sp.]